MAKSKKEGKSFPSLAIEPQIDAAVIAATRGSETPSLELLIWFPRHQCIIMVIEVQALRVDIYGYCLQFNFILDSLLSVLAMQFMKRGTGRFLVGWYYPMPADDEEERAYRLLHFHNQNDAYCVPANSDPVYINLFLA